MPTLNIVGCGHLGQTLARLWARAGVFEIRQVLNRSVESADKAVRFIGAGQAVGTQDALVPADFTLIATPDEAISRLCSALAQDGLFGAGQVVFHCSGALPASVLAPASRLGASVACVHPIRSFADPEQATMHFAGTWCGTDGDAQALSLLEPAFHAIGARTVAIDPARKNIYHGAAVFASNYVVAVLELALQAYEKAGVPRAIALQLIEPLVRGTVNNVIAHDTTGALSGPIARGDTATVLRQYRALRRWDKGVGRAYRTLAKPAAAIARRRRRG